MESAPNVYNNGVLKLTSTSPIWRADFQTYCVGNQSAVFLNRSFGGIWKASIIYSSLSQPIAALDAAFRDFYGI